MYLVEDSRSMDPRMLRHVLGHFLTRRQTWSPLLPLVEVVAGRP